MIILTRLAGIQKKLIEKACKVMNNAYMFWGFQVGAAVLAEDGRIYEGCNVESRVSGLGTCAERNAINHAVLHGNRKIKGIAVVMNSESLNEPRPYGACLQYIHDFAENTSIEIAMVKARGERILFETVQTKTLANCCHFPMNHRALDSRRGAFLLMEIVCPPSLSKHQKAQLPQDYLAPPIEGKYDIGEARAPSR